MAIIYGILAIDLLNGFGMQILMFALLVYPEINSGGKHNRENIAQFVSGVLFNLG